jgi:hypothetical protein
MARKPTKVFTGDFGKLDHFIVLKVRKEAAAIAPPALEVVSFQSDPVRGLRRARKNAVFGDSKAAVDLHPRKRGWLRIASPS